LNGNERNITISTRVTQKGLAASRHDERKGLPESHRLSAHHGGKPLNPALLLTKEEYGFQPGGGSLA